MKGSNLICIGRGYEYYQGNLKTARKSLNAYISDGMIIYDYFVKNVHNVISLYNIIYSSHFLI